MGIDPGSLSCGYGIINVVDNYHYQILDAGCIKLNPKKDFNLRIKEIFDQISDLIQKNSPDFVAFEDVFVSKNFSSGLKLVQARTAAVLAALNLEVSIDFYTAREVKQAVTGYGNASKQQIQTSVTRLLKLEKPLSTFDVSDALAIAICHAQRVKKPYEKRS